MGAEVGAIEADLPEQLLIVAEVLLSGGHVAERVAVAGDNRHV